MRRWILVLLRETRLLMVLAALDALFFGLTDPSNTNSFIIILAGALLGLTVYAVVFLVVTLLGVFISAGHRTRKRLSVFSALLFTFVILMQSIGQLSFRDVLAAAALALALYMYFTYISKDKVENI